MLPSPYTKKTTYKAYFWSWLQILVIPYIMWATYIFYPYEKPQKGLANNWVSNLYHLLNMLSTSIPSPSHQLSLIPLCSYALTSNNIFMVFAMPFGSLWVIAVYGYWGKVFLGTVYKAPVIITSAVLTLLYWLISTCIYWLFLYYCSCFFINIVRFLDTDKICQFVAFPVTLLGLVVILVLTVCFPASLYPTRYPPSPIPFHLFP